MRAHKHQLEGEQPEAGQPIDDDELIISPFQLSADNLMTLFNHLVGSKTVPRPKASTFNFARSQGRHTSQCHDIPFYLNGIVHVIHGLMLYER